MGGKPRVAIGEIIDFIVAVVGVFSLGLAVFSGIDEASHGTSEFYKARAAITRHLIEHHGFTVVAVEADWPDAATVDRYVRHRPAVATEEPPFQRFPTWMWRNTDVQALIGWMRERNAKVDAAGCCAPTCVANRSRTRS